MTEINEDKKASKDLTILLGITNEWECFTDQYKEPYIRTIRNGIKEDLLINSTSFDNLISHEYYSLTKRACPNNQFISFKQLLNAKARFDGKQYTLHERFHFQGNNIWIDLINESNSTIQINSDGWNLINDIPVLFRRFSHQKQMPTPIRGGHIFELLHFFNIEEQDKDGILLIAWLVAAHFPNIARPILCFHGEKGTAKTTAAKILRDLIDPSEIPVLFLNNNIAETQQNIAHHAIPVFDNVGGIPWNMQNLLCTAVTGGGSSKRKLYTDKEDVIEKYQRAMILTSIAIPAEASDLRDRLLSIELSRIPKTKRREELKILKEFENAKPKIHGALLDIISLAMNFLPSISLKELPRLADFTQLGCAVAKALGLTPDDFLTLMESNHNKLLSEARDDTIFNAAITCFSETETWEGTPTQLKKKLEETFNIGNTNSKLPTDWPKNVNHFSRKLKLIQPDLSDVGIHITWLSGRRDGRKIVINAKDYIKSSSSPSSDNNAETNKIPKNKEDNSLNPQENRDDDFDQIFGRAK